MDWANFIVALVVFFALHAVPVRPAVKSRIVRMTGPLGFSVLYSLVSLGALVWIIVAAGRAPYVGLWPDMLWQRHVALALMGVAIVILALGIARPNPLSFGGANNHMFDPQSPGIVGWVRHPLLAAIGTWALAHLIANGDLAHVIVFGLFASFALVGMMIIDRRKQRQMGDDWHRFAATSRRMTLTPNGMIRLVIAAGIYAALIALHGTVIGVYPLG